MTKYNILTIVLIFLVLILVIHGLLTPSTGEDTISPTEKDTGEETLPSVEKEIRKDTVGAGGTLTILAFDNNGNQLNYRDFSKNASTLLVSTIDNNPVSGRPWLKNANNYPTIEWTNATIEISIAWELPITGYSTIYLDNEGEGYDSSKTINFNFEALKTQWRIFNKSHDKRINSKLSYTPSNQFLELYSQAKMFMDQANLSQTESQKAVYSNKGLDKITQAWELMLREYGTQYGKNFYPNGFLFGVTIDDLSDYKHKLDMAKNQGNDYVRIIFERNKRDFTFQNEDSFYEYDLAIDYAKKIGLEVMGEVVDSQGWPRHITVDMYRQRTHNLASRYKGKIPIWEVGNEINGNWIGGETDPIDDSLIVDSVNAAAEDIKMIDSNARIAVTLYWTEGLVGDDDHPLFLWIEKWKKDKNFGKNIDIIALSIYPQYNPVGSAFDIIINRLQEKFPDKKIMIGEFGYFYEDSYSHVYWWHSRDINVIQKELIEQYYTSMMGYNYSINGGFWWFFSEMTENTQLYNTYKEVITSFKQ